MQVISGVPQGSVIGPLFFLILIADIDEEVATAIVRSFADDTRATNAIKGAIDVECLQKDLCNIYKWADDNNMSLNDKKFEAMRYGLLELLKTTTNYLTPGGKPIESKKLVKDLGILLSNDCSFRPHIDELTEKARNMISWIMRLFKSHDKYVMLTL